MHRKNPIPDPGNDELAIIQALKVMDTTKKQELLSKIEQLNVRSDKSVINPSIDKHEK